MGLQLWVIALFNALWDSLHPNRSNKKVFYVPYVQVPACRAGKVINHKLFAVNVKMDISFMQKQDNVYL